MDHHCRKFYSALTRITTITFTFLTPQKNSPKKHTAWMNGCIGHFNHRYFFLFMLYMWLGCVYIASVTYKPFALVRAGKSFLLMCVCVCVCVCCIEFFFFVCFFSSSYYLSFPHPFFFLTLPFALFTEIETQTGWLIEFIQLILFFFSQVAIIPLFFFCRAVISAPLKIWD